MSILPDWTYRSRGPASALWMKNTGRIVPGSEKCISEPEALLTALKNPSYHFKRIGLEAGPLSQWLFSALAEAELPVVCRHGAVRRWCRRELCWNSV